MDTRAVVVVEDPGSEPGTSAGGGIAALQPVANQPIAHHVLDALEAAGIEEIVVACSATLYAHGHHEVRDGADAAQALRPLAGDYAYLLFALGLLNASLFAAAILPLSTAYTVCEGLGFESGLDKKFREAPFFYWLYTILIAAGGAIILVPNLPLVKISILSQVINGAVLPFVLVFMLMLINKNDLMGEYVNRPTFNVIAWA